MTGEANRAEFLRSRKKGIGGSDAAAVLNESRWKTPLEVWFDKTGRTPDEDEEDAPERLLWGNLLEDIVAKEYARRTDRKVRRRTAQVVHGEFGFMRCHLDRTVSDPDKRGGGVLQVKTTGEYMARDWEDEPPIEVQVQIQHEMCVVGAKWGSIAVLIGGNRLRFIDVEPNPNFVRVMIERERWFWEFVKKDEAPPIEKYDGRTLALLYPVETSEAAIALPPASVEIDERLRAVKEQLSTLRTEKDELEARIKAEIGEHAVGVMPDGSSYHWATVKRKGYKVAETSYRQLRRRKART